MSSYLIEYLPILIFIFIGLGISIGMTAFSFIAGESKPDYENICHEIVDYFSSNLNKYGSGYTFMLQAVEFMAGPSYEILIVGENNQKTKEEREKILMDAKEAARKAGLQGAIATGWEKGWREGIEKRDSIKSD